MGSAVDGDEPSALSHLAADQIQRSSCGARFTVGAATGWDDERSTLAPRDRALGDSDHSLWISRKCFAGARLQGSAKRRNRSTVTARKRVVVTTPGPAGIALP